MTISVKQFLRAGGHGGITIALLRTTTASPRAEAARCTAAASKDAFSARMEAVTAENAAMILDAVGDQLGPGRDGVATSAKTLDTQAKTY